jgi:hypothetical protein
MVALFLISEIRMPIFSQIVSLAIPWATSCNRVTIIMIMMVASSYGELNLWQALDKHDFI